MYRIQEKGLFTRRPQHVTRDLSIHDSRLCCLDRLGDLMCPLMKILSTLAPFWEWMEPRAKGEGWGLRPWSLTSGGYNNTRSCILRDLAWFAASGAFARCVRCFHNFGLSPRSPVQRPKWIHAQIPSQTSLPYTAKQSVLLWIELKARRSYSWWVRSPSWTTRNSKNTSQ